MMTSVKYYTAFIASMDDYNGSADDLPMASQGVTIYDFEVPKGTGDDTATLVARGIFFNNGWSMEDSISTVIENSQPTTPEDILELAERYGFVVDNDNESQMIIYTGVYETPIQNNWTGWVCSTSPTGKCAYDDGSDPAHDQCLYCGDPEERK
jgi:hypothetical protein